MADLPIGATIARVRRKRGLTQREVAARMGCPRTYLSKVENGHSYPQLEQFVRIADAMEVNPWSLLRLVCTLREQLERTAA
jgi:transcriptional regulator with XRE-family HTH domain